MLKKKLKSKNFKLAVFVSSEGFGHSVRQKTLISEILKKFPDMSITVFSDKRLIFLKEFFGTRINYIHYKDTLLTIKNLDGSLDLKKTKKQIKLWKSISQKNIKKLISSNLKFDLIISDLIPEAFYFAKKLKIPAYGVARFSWDWFFYKTELKKMNELKLISNYLKMANKIFLPAILNSKSLSESNYSTKKINLVFSNKNFIENTFQFAKSNNKFCCLIMDNGTQTNTNLIKYTIKYLDKIKNIDFYIAVDNFSDSLKNYIVEKNNLIPVTGLKNMHRLIEYVDFIVARGGFNTITEILIFKKPALLINEKNNPEIKANLVQLTKKGYASQMNQADFGKNFQKRVCKFIRYEMKKISKNLNSSLFLSNGTQQIIKHISKDYEKN